MSRPIHQAVSFGRDQHVADAGEIGDAMTLHSRTDGPHRPLLAALHQRTVAVQLALREGEATSDKTVIGRGVYEHDSELGNILRIELPSEVGCHFVIVESSWDGQVESGERFGCEFLIRIG